MKHHWWQPCREVAPTTHRSSNVSELLVVSLPLSGFVSFFLGGELNVGNDAPKVTRKIYHISVKY